jgi:hypothetical protein
MRADEAPIASPCTEDLERMHLDPSGLRRHCDRCCKTVHDLSAMGPEPARALLAATREPICISYETDRRGELVFVPLSRLAQAATLVASLSACVSLGDDPHPKEPTAEAYYAPVHVIPIELEPSKPASQVEEVDEAEEEPCEPTADAAHAIPPKRTPTRMRTAGVYAR